MTTEQFTDKIINELREAGLDYDAMLRALQLVKEKYEAMKQNPVCPECGSDIIYDFETNYACDECGFVWAKNQQ